MIIITLAIIPAIIWLFVLPLPIRFGNFLATMTSLGQLTGLVGAALFALSLILSARLKFFDRHLQGLNRVYINHHRLGAIAFSLLLFHPLFLTVRYIVFSLPSAVWFWLGSAGWAVILGELSLFAMILLLVLTFFISLRYHIWKSTHKFLGLAFFLGALHMFFIPSDVSRNLLLRYYMLGLSALGIVAYIYHTILGKWSAQRYVYTVEEIKNLNAEVIEITLSPFDSQKKLIYAPGQFAFINFNDRMVSLEQHPFSFLSAPEENAIKFGIKNLGDYTSQMKNISRGALAKIEGPYGKFSYFNFLSKQQIWIAGGIGITPFISMAKHLNSQKNNNYKIDLYYCVRNKAEMILLNELVAMAENNNNFRILQHCSNEDGLINAKVVNEKSQGLVNKDILVCGPPLMMKNLKEQFLQLGVKHNNIHSEEFSL